MFADVCAFEQMFHHVIQGGEDARHTIDVPPEQNHLSSGEPTQGVNAVYLAVRVNFDEAVHDSSRLGRFVIPLFQLAEYELKG
jgi:hypothetical protein